MRRLQAKRSRKKAPVRMAAGGGSFTRPTRVDQAAIFDSHLPEVSHFRAEPHVAGRVFRVEDVRARGPVVYARADSRSILLAGTRADERKGTCKPMTLDRPSLTCFNPPMG